MKRWGILFQPGGVWIGAHYSRFERRWCINPVPCVTLWITLKGGRPPARVQQREDERAQATWRAECKRVSGAGDF
jgi:hypothetical protein